MGKIISQSDIPIYHDKYKNKKIVAACGCFDIFHIGHLDYLSGAKKLGDVLFVGINSDESVYKNKKKYPIFNEKQRMAVINAIKYVDYVFCYNEITFDYSLEIIHPDIFARGVDAAEKGFPEQDTVNVYMIKVVNVGDYKKSSSRELRKEFE